MLSRIKGKTSLTLLLLFGLGTLSLRASASQCFPQTSIQVSAAEVDVDLVRHGPHDCWPQRMIREVAKSNYGAQVEDGVKALSIYMKTPDGPQVRSVSNLEELKEIYQSLNIDWDSVYGEENWDPDFCKEVGR